MAAEKSRKSSEDLFVRQQPRTHLQPFDRLRRFKRVKGYLKEYDGSRFAMLKVTENDYKTLCQNTSRIVLSETQQLPRNDRYVKIFLRKEAEEENNNEKSASSSSVDKVLSHKVKSRPPTFAAPSTPRPQKRLKNFVIEQTDEK